MNKLENKVAYITGGSKGIGLGIAKSLLENGMRVAITGRKLKAVQEAADSLINDKSRILALQSDVANAEDEINAVQATLKHFGQLDVVIANAGIGHFAPIDTISEAQWHETIDTNLTGVFHTVKASVERIKKSKGYFIIIGSLAGINFSANSAAYNASKFGLVGFSQAIMLDLRNYGVKVTTILPGSVTSYFNGNIPDEKDAWKIQPEDMGQMVLDLLHMHPRTLPSKIEVRPLIPNK